MRLTEEGKGCLGVLTAGALWGTIGMFIAEMAACGSSAALTSFLRLGLAFLMIGGLTVLKYGARALLIDGRALLPCALLGIVCHGVYNFLYSLSIAANGVALSAVLLYSAPVFTALAARLLFGERLSRRRVLALALDILGCVLAVTGGRLSLAGISAFGVLVGVGAGFCYGMIAVIGKVAGQRADAFVLSAWSYFFAALFLLLFMRPSFAPLNSKLALLGLLYALIPTSLAYVIYYTGLRKVRETSKVPILTSVEPVVAAVIGMAVYHEDIGGTTLLGIGLVLCAIAMMREA